MTPRRAATAPKTLTPKALTLLARLSPKGQAGVIGFLMAVSGVRGNRARRAYFTPRQWRSYVADRRLGGGR